VVKESRNVGHDGRAALPPFEFVGFAVQVDLQRGGLFTDDLPDTTPMIPPEKPLKKEASKASKKKDKSKVQRPQTVEKKLPTSDSTQAAKPQGAEPQSVPSQPAPSQLRTLWPEAPAPGTFSR
jgi:hypothetical protein